MAPATALILLAIVFASKFASWTIVLETLLAVRVKGFVFTPLFGATPDVPECTASRSRPEITKAPSLLDSTLAIEKFIDSPLSVPT